jgi:transposase-like protein
VLTRLGEVTFEVPQVRSGGFYPSALERGSRSKQAMNLALAEMYVQGVSTRKVITVLQKLVEVGALHAGHPQLAAWAEVNLPEGFAVFGLP